MVVENGLLYAFAHCLQAGEMDDGIDVVFGKDSVHAFLVQQIHLIKLEVFAGDFPDAVQCLRLGVDEVVEDDDFLPLVQQLHAGVRTNVAGAAGDQYCHFAQSFLWEVAPCFLISV